MYTIIVESIDTAMTVILESFRNVSKVAWGQRVALVGNNKDYRCKLSARKVM